jgi:hypothetical protein
MGHSQNNAIGHFNIIMTFFTTRCVSPLRFYSEENIVKRRRPHGYGYNARFHNVHVRTNDASNYILSLSHIQLSSGLTNSVLLPLSCACINVGVKKCHILSWKLAYIAVRTWPGRAMRYHQQETFLDELQSSNLHHRCEKVGTGFNKLKEC